MSSDPGPAGRAPGGASAHVRAAAARAARFLGASSVRGLLIGSAAWFTILTIPDLISGRPATWTLYAESAGGYIAGCAVYRSAKRALAAWTSARRA